VSNDITGKANHGDTAYGWGNHATNDYATGTPIYVESDPNWGAVSNDITSKAGHGDTAYGWGNWSTNGLATGTPVYVESDPNWGAVSNTVVYSNTPTYTDTVAKASAALPKAGGTMTGELQVPALRISGTPTNGAVFVCSNTATGQGVWRVYPKFYSYSSTATAFANATATEIPFNNTTICGGTFDGTYWTPGVVGWVSLSGGIEFTSKIVTGHLLVFFNKNGAALDQGTMVFDSGIGYPAVKNSGIFPNDNATNRFSLAVIPYVGSTITNRALNEFTSFSGTVLP
jgi:hypothetical protein